MISLLLASLLAPAEPTVVACKFERWPLMVFMFRGTSESGKSTLQIGEGKPVPISEGSNLVTATYRGQEFVFSLRTPATVTAKGGGNDSITYNGECVSTLPVE